jgi:hypothetical protein
MTNMLLQVCAVSLLAATTIQAFSVVPTQRFGVSTASLTSASPLISRQYNSQPLSMAASEGAEDSEVETTEETAAEEDAAPVEAELTEDEPAVVEDEGEVEEITATEAEPTAEELELVALKEEIATMEKTLKERRVQVALTADTADEFSSSGYARKVAEMEMMRRNKRVSTICAEIRVQCSIIKYNVWRVEISCCWSCRGLTQHVHIHIYRPCNRPTAIVLLPVSWLISCPSMTSCRN